MPDLLSKSTLAQADELELELELEVSSRSGCCAARRSASVLASAGCSSSCRESVERCVSAHDWLLQLAARCGRITAERRTHQRARAPQMGAPEARPARRAWADARMCSVLGRDERVHLFLFHRGRAQSTESRPALMYTPLLARFSPKTTVKIGRTGDRNLEKGHQQKHTPVVHS